MLTPVKSFLPCTSQAFNAPISKRVNLSVMSCRIHIRILRPDLKTVTQLISETARTWAGS